MRGRSALASFVGALVLTTSAAASDVVPWSRESPEYWVSQAVGAASFYEWDHHSYKGMTVAKLRRMNSRLRNVRVVRATRSSYCVEARVNGLAAFRNGPAAMIRRGTCAKPRAGKAVPPDPSPEPAVTSATRNLRAAGPALAAYVEDHRGYAKLSLAGLQEYDASVNDLVIVWAERATFCLESVTDEGSAYWESGELIAPGTCPRI